MEELVKRKHPRLDHYDYSSAGAYFVTICTQNRRCLLSHVVGRGLAPAALELTEYGKIAEEQLLLIEKCYPSIKIDKYVIMPNHIHFILVITNETAGASPRPTVMDVICAYKSLTTRRCKQVKPIDKLFQTSFLNTFFGGMRITKRQSNTSTKTLCVGIMMNYIPTNRGPAISEAFVSQESNPQNSNLRRR